MAQRVGVPDDLDAPGLPEAPDDVDAYPPSATARSLVAVAERVSSPRATGSTAGRLGP